MRISKGSIYRRGSVWWYCLTVNGRKIRQSLGTSIQQEALKKFAQIKENLLLGVPLFSLSSISFFDFLEKYEEFLVSTKAYNTIRREKIIIKKLKRFFGDIPLSSISQERIERYLQTHCVNPATYNRERAVIKCLFNKGIEWGYVKVNPTEKLKKLKIQQKPVRYLSDKEIAKILAHSGHFRDIIVFLLNTGLRLSEFVNLKWEDIDFKKRLIAVKETKSYKVRYIPITQQVEEILSRWKNEGKPVFSKSYISHKINKIGRLAGFKNISPHIFRHTFASRLVMSGVNLRTVQTLLGHSDIKTTMIYSHLAPDYFEGIEDKLKYEI